MNSEIENITISDLPDELQDIADRIGLPSTIKLVQLCGGISVYIPKMETMARMVRHRRMYSDYRESTSSSVFKDLAKKYGYSESHTRAVIRAMSAS